MFTTSTWLKIICSMMINAVLFGIGTITVLSIPTLEAQAKYLIPAVIVLSFALSYLIASKIAPRMRLRNWGKRNWQKGDKISG
ncbi:hypothetical protein [Rhizobium wenxiniae]|uniref:hypothetical protein n=1 Tax=Rhizobium wenxiniae TaxID=1737357 RepID=UPI003C237686